MKQFLHAILFFLISFSASSQNPLPVTNVDPLGAGLKINLYGNGYTQKVVSIGNTIFFVGMDSEHGQALWKYNATTKEYALIKDIYPGSGAGTITSLVALNNKFYFAASDDLTSNMFDIYMSDGTEAGTVLLFASTATEKFYSGPVLLKAGSLIYFETQIDGVGNSLYSINGSTITQLKNTGFGGAISPYNSASYGGYLFFMGYDDVNGAELWRSDGTSAGTGLFINLSYENAGSNFYDFVEVNNQLLFTGVYKTLGYNSGVPYELVRRGLFKITSPSSEPELFYDYDSPANGGIHIQGSFNSFAQQNGPAVLNGVLYFAGSTVNSAGLCRTDGTAAGTYMVKDFAGGGVEVQMAKFNDKIIFEAFEATDRSLWLSDGTSNGTYKIGDKFVNSGNVGKFFIRGNRIYASGYYDGITHLNSAVWSTDGTNDGTVILTPDCYNTSTGPQDIFENIGDSIYFQGQLNGCVNNFQLNKFTIPTKIWLGKVSTDWNNANNWDPVGVPANTADVVIPGGITNYPVISANAVARNLWINWGSVTVASGKQLTVNGELSVMGSLTGDGSLVMAAAGNDNLHGQGAIDIASVIINGSDVTLKGNKEFKKVDFLSNNKIFLSDNNLVVTGDVTGYNASRYFVTNGTGTVTIKNIETTPVVFPVGNSQSSYNPLTITNNGTIDNFSVRVIQGVYENGNSGAAITGNAVNRTWLVDKSGGGADITLKAQWNAIDELSGFSRSNAYLSHYIDNAWDTYLPGAASAAGGSFTLSRSGINNFSPFTVFSGAAIDSDNDGTPDNLDCAPLDPSKWRSATLYFDFDRDGYTQGSTTVCYGATIPQGYSLTENGDDCDDNNFDIHESFDFYTDIDGDGYGTGIKISRCALNANTPPGGYSLNNTDCDDNDNLKHASFSFYADTDADGFGSGNPVSVCAVNATTAPEGYSINSTDNCPSTTNPDQADSDQDGIGNVCDNSNDDDGDGIANESDCAPDDNTKWRSASLYIDADADGYNAGTATICYGNSVPVGYSLISGGNDCNDNDASIHPGAAEICDGKDNNCNGTIDEGVKSTFYRDADGDNYGNPNVTIQSCTAPSGYVSNSTDCNDTKNSVYPGAPEICDGLDNNCNGQIDDGITFITYYKDNDNDGYGNASQAVSSCSPVNGYVSAAGDCNDNNPSINPGATEVCDGIDNNCNAVTDEGVKTTFYRDADADNYGNLSITILACTAPSGYVSNSTDCNDGDATIYPGATEVCDNKDNNCDGQVDNNVQTLTYYRDVDADGYGTSSITLQACSPPAGYVSISGDCNDNNAAIKPGATEICDGLDNDCDGQIDEGVKTTFYRDADADNYGNPSITILACTAPSGYVSNSTDCNDGDATIHPGATEVCDNKDNNCDGQVDNNVQTLTYYRDVDADGYGTSSITLQACSPPAGYVSISGDCNDNNAAINPGAIEICDGIDNDCDGQIDEGVKITYYADADGDGFGNASVTTQACTKPTGYVANNTDCNDNNAAIKPGAIEICDGLDNDCDGQIDEGVKTTFYRDADNDGFGNAGITIQACTTPSGYVTNSTDCNDNNSSIKPGATEVCGNNIDDDCDGLVDEGCNTANLPVISIGNTTISEGNNGNKNATFVLRLSKRSNTPVTVQYQTANNSAIAPDDYVQKGGTVTFPQNNLVQNIVVQVKGDRLNEADEKFTIQLSNAVNGTVSVNSATCTINDDDPKPDLRISNAVATESSQQALLQVDLTAASGLTVTMKYDTRDGTAKAPGDYTAISNGTLQFQPGETTKYISIVVKQDALNESTERFEVRLKQPENAAFGRRDAEVRITNSAPVLTKNAPGTSSSTDESRITVSPNPANQQLNLRLFGKTFSGKIQVELLDQSGRLVKQWMKSYSGEGQLIDLPVADIASGVYVVVIKDGKGRRMQYKVVVQH